MKQKKHLTVQKRTPNTSGTLTFDVDYEVPAKICFEGMVWV